MNIAIDTPEWQAFYRWLRGVTIFADDVVLRAMLPVEGGFRDLEGVAEAARVGPYETSISPSLQPFYAPWGFYEPAKRAEYITQRVANCWQEAKLPDGPWQIPFSVSMDGQPVGMIELYGKEGYLDLRHVEILNVWTRKDRHRGGIASRAVIGALEFAFARQGFQAEVALAAVYAENRLSLLMFNRLCFSSPILDREMSSLFPGKSPVPRDILALTMTRNHWRDVRRLRTEIFPPAIQSARVRIEQKRNGDFHAVRRMFGQPSYSVPLVGVREIGDLTIGPISPDNLDAAARFAHDHGWVSEFPSWVNTVEDRTAFVRGWLKAASAFEETALVLVASPKENPTRVSGMVEFGADVVVALDSQDPTRVDVLLRNSVGPSRRIGVMDLYQAGDPVEIFDNNSTDRKQPWVFGKKYVSTCPPGISFDGEMSRVLQALTKKSDSGISYHFGAIKSFGSRVFPDRASVFGNPEEFQTFSLFNAAKSADLEQADQWPNAELAGECAALLVRGPVALVKFNIREMRSERYGALPPYSYAPLENQRRKFWKWFSSPVNESLIVGVAANVPLPRQTGAIDHSSFRVLRLTVNEGGNGQDVGNALLEQASLYMHTPLRCNEPSSSLGL